MSQYTHSLWVKQLRMQGWDHYLVRGPAGSQSRARALELFCHLVQDDQLIVVTDAADVQVLQGPEQFARTHSKLMVRPYPFFDCLGFDCS